jgi:hypothetical protein
MEGGERNELWGTNNCCVTSLLSILSAKATTEGAVLLVWEVKGMWEIWTEVVSPGESEKKTGDGVWKDEVLKKKARS